MPEDGMTIMICITARPRKIGQPGHAVPQSEIFANRGTAAATAALGMLRKCEKGDRQWHAKDLGKR